MGCSQQSRVLDSATVLILMISLWTQCLHHLSVMQMPCRTRVWVNLDKGFEVGKSSKEKWIELEKKIVLAMGGKGD